ncbi:MAG: DUF3883 domain-containing protein, partial [Saprospiraceae bacterium]|nr:DUF3883 domain-containing protein [Saprospiraceae bacterium]
VKYEQWQLSISGHDKLATQVEWVSQSEGDGAGFDILSKNFNGSDKYIEVKTTRLGKETPFFFSRNELRFSQRNRDSYHLYRLFNFGQKARMFKKLGDFDSTCTFYPFMYKGFP